MKLRTIKKTITQQRDGQQSGVVHRITRTVPVSNWQDPLSWQNRTITQAHIQQLQQYRGNRAVQRHLLGHTFAVQRASNKSKKSSSNQKKRSVVTVPDNWLHKATYQILAKQLGEAKLNEHAKSIAEAASKFLVDQVKATHAEGQQVDTQESTAKPKLNFVEDAQLAQMGKALTSDLQRGIAGIFNSEDGQKIRAAILKRSQRDPATSVGLVLLALGAVYAMKMEVPVDDIDLGNNAKGSVKVQSGGIDGPFLEHLQLGIRVAGEYFMTVGYQDKEVQTRATQEGQQPKREQTAKVFTGVTLDPNGLFTFSIDSALRLSDAVEKSVQPKPKAWLGAAALQIGNKETHITPRVEVDKDGNVALRLSSKATDLLGISHLSGSATMGFSIAKKLQLSDAGLQLSYEYKATNKNSLFSVLGITLSGQYKAPTDQQPQNVQVLLLLSGRLNL